MNVPPKNYCLFNCQTIYTALHDLEITLDDYNDNWGSLALSLITTCNVLVVIELALDIFIDDVIP